MISNRRFHELVGHPHGVVGVLEEDRAVGVAVDGRIVTGVDQRVRLLLFFLFAVDELLDVGMVRVENHHLGRAASLPSALDDARKRVEALHEAQRSRGFAAAGEQSILFAQGGQIRSRPRPPLEQHALGLRQIQNRFQRVAHGIDEAGRTLRAALALPQRHDGIGVFVPVPTVTPRLFYAHVEPHRRVEARLLGQHQVSQLIAEILRVGGCAEVVPGLSPVRYGVHHAMHQLGNAALPVRRTGLPVEVLADHDVGGRLRPIRRHIDIGLLEDDLALVVGDGGGARFPFQLVVRRAAGLEFLREVFREGDADALRGRKRPFAVLEFAHPGTEVNAELSHLLL